MTMTNTFDPSRRLLLTRLGLALGVAYVAPTMAGFDVARASGVSAGSRPSRASNSGPSRGPKRRVRRKAKASVSKLSRGKIRRPKPVRRRRRRLARASRSGASR